VPEPHSLLAAASGVAAFALVRARRKDRTVKRASAAD
jgi:hypothetical protein